MMYRWRRTIALGLVLLVLLTIGGFGVRYVLQKENVEEMDKKTFQFDERDPSPPTTSDEDDAFPDTLIGHVEPFREATISTPVNGTIQQLDVREGQTISENQVPNTPSDTPVIRMNGASEDTPFDENPVLNLPPYPSGQILARLGVQKIRFRLDEINAQIQKTRLELRDARRKEHRIREAIQDGGAGTVYSQQDLDDAVSAVNLAESELDRLRSQRSRLAEQARDHYIHAPFPGEIGSVMAEKGEWLTAGQPLFTLMDLSRVKIVFYVTERMEPMIRTRDAFTFTVDAFPDRTEPFDGTVYSISPATESDHHRFKVVLTLKNPDEARLKPGMICRVNLR